MISAQKAIFPGMTLGCIFLILIAGWIANPQVSFAENLPVISTQAADIAVVAVQDSVEQQPPAESAPPVEESAESDSPECSISAGYPEAILRWCGYVDRYAQENGLDPNLIAAVMLQESGGNPDAYSKSGAVGLMQVMPRDGLSASFMCINGPCFASRPSTAELYDPEFNIRYGAGMLAGLIRRYGDVREGLRSYGPMNMGYRYADIILDIMARY